MFFSVIFRCSNVQVSFLLTSADHMTKHIISVYILLRRFLVIPYEGLYGDLL